MSPNTMRKSHHLLLSAAVAILALMLIPFSGAFSVTPAESSSRLSTQLKKARLHKDDSIEFAVDRTIVRRNFLMSTAALFTSLPANAAMENAQKVFVQGKQLSIDEAKARFKEARKSLQYLLDNYDEICQGGGDNVRRYLGTVGTSSGMFGIGKVMKTLSGEADDLVEYTEASNDVEQSVQQADGSAYMAIFVTTSSSSTPPEKYFNDAKIEIKRCLRSMDEVASQINLKL